MPIPDSRTPEADAALLRFIERRRRRRARHRRQLMLLGATTALGLIVFTVAMVSQRLSRSGPSPAATIVARPPAPPAPAPQPTARAEKAPSRPATATPSAPVAERAPDSQPDTRTTPATTEPPAARERETRTSTAGVELPPARETESLASAQTEQPAARKPETGVASVALVPRRVEPVPATPEPPVDLDPAARTARWYLQTYGRVEAENRVAMVEEFYSGEQRAFWRRVLADVRQTRER